jgi:DNA-binding transcriptional LysR family regulator
MRASACSNSWSPQALRMARDEGESPSGTLRLNVPRAAARNVLAPVLAPFHARCPRVQLEVVCQDGLVDIVAQGFDAGIRFGASLAQDMVAVPIAPAQRFVVVAAPAYLRARGRPRRPEDLHAHDCIGLRFPSGVRYAWEFVRKGQAVQVQTQGPLVVDEEALALAAARDGLGLAYVYEQQARHLLAGGALQSVLDDWCPPAEHFFLYYPSRRHVPAALRVLIELLMQPEDGAAR